MPYNAMSGIVPQITGDAGDTLSASPFFFAMLNVMLTSPARRSLSKILETERRENPNAVFRIWETRRGVHNDAVYGLRLGLDEREQNDEMTLCAGLPFVADRDFLDLRGRTPTFYIVTDKHGMPSVHPGNS